MSTGIPSMPGSLQMRPRPRFLPLPTGGGVRSIKSESKRTKVLGRSLAGR